MSYVSGVVDSRDRESRFDIRQASRGEICGIITATVMGLLLSGLLIGAGIKCASSKPLNPANHKITSCAKGEDSFLITSGAVLFILITVLIVIPIYNFTKDVRTASPEGLLKKK